MKSYQIEGRRKRKLSRKEAGQCLVTMKLSWRDLAGISQAQIKRWSQEAGLLIMQRAMEEERRRLAEGPDAVGYRWGSQEGYVVLDGRKVSMAHPRVRSFQKEEVPLESYRLFQVGMGEAAHRDLLRGISCRDYGGGTTGLLQGYGIARSSISRHFIERTEEELRRLLERNLSDWDLGVIYIDGIRYAQTLLVVALGIDVFGRKHTLGVWQGATENTTVCRALLEDLIRRGLDVEKKYLFIIDGGKGLRAALDEMFGQAAWVQRCQEHKKRNVVEHLPKDQQALWRGRLAKAYGESSEAAAKAALWSCVEDLRRINPSAARSLLEGLDETLILHRLGVPASLRRSLSTTNVLESGFSCVRHRTDRVTRWRPGDQVQRWVAGALWQAEEKSWTKIKGWRQLWKLWELLDRNALDSVPVKN